MTFLSLSLDVALSLIYSISTVNTPDAYLRVPLPWYDLVSKMAVAKYGGRCSEPVTQALPGLQVCTMIVVKVNFWEVLEAIHDVPLL